MSEELQFREAISNTSPLLYLHRIGARKGLFDLRRAAVVHNLHQLSHALRILMVA